MKKSDQDRSRRDSRPDRPAQKFRRTWGIIFSVLLIAYVAWTLLDAFVIPQNIIEASSVKDLQDNADSQDSADSQPDADSQDSADSQPDADSQDTADSQPDADPVPSEPIITDHSYKDDSISIEITTTRYLDTTIYTADVVLQDPLYFGTALAQNSFGRNLTDTTSNMAREHNAIFAVNGDYYGFRSNGYVMRGGYLYRSEPLGDPDQEDLVLYRDGSLAVIREEEVSAESIAETEATDIFSFGPALILDGEICVKKGEEVDRAQVTNPRTAVGLIEPLHYVFVVSDGRTEESHGLSLLQLAQYMSGLNCTLAYNLDGGGSSTMWFNGQVLNRPTTFGDKIAERALSDIIYIGRD